MSATIIDGQALAAGGIYARSQRRRCHNVGINRVSASNGERRIVGDVAFDEVRKVAGVMTPVPGGGGPVTVAIPPRSAAQAATSARAKLRNSSNP